MLHTILFAYFERPVILLLQDGNVPALNHNNFGAVYNVLSGLFLSPVQSTALTTILFMKCLYNSHTVLPFTLLFASLPPVYLWSSMGLLAYNLNTNCNIGLVRHFMFLFSFRDALSAQHLNLLINYYLLFSVKKTISEPHVNFRSFFESFGTNSHHGWTIDDIKLTPFKKDNFQKMLYSHIFLEGFSYSKDFLKFRAKISGNRLLLIILKKYCCRQIF